jgi:hypothetical protein
VLVDVVGPCCHLMARCRHGSYVTLGNAHKHRLISWLKGRLLDMLFFDQFPKKKNRSRCLRSFRSQHQMAFVTVSGLRLTLWLEDEVTARSGFSSDPLRILVQADWPTLISRFPRELGLCLSTCPPWQLYLHYPSLGSCTINRFQISDLPQHIRITDACGQITFRPMLN